MKSMNNNRSQSIIKDMSKMYLTKSRKCQNPYPYNPRSNKLGNKCSYHLNSTLALNLEHEGQRRNRITASNLEKG